MEITKYSALKVSLMISEQKQQVVNDFSNKYLVDPYGGSSQ